MREKVVRVLEEEYLLLLLDISGDEGDLEKMYVGHIWTVGPNLPYHHGSFLQSPLIIASEFTYPPLPVLGIFL